MVCEQTGCTLKVALSTSVASLLFDEYVKLLSPRTKLVGSPMYRMPGLHSAVEANRGCRATRRACRPRRRSPGRAHAHVDFAPGVRFLRVLRHKLYGPTGIGVLYGREELLESMPPWQGGGDMILTCRSRRDLQRPAGSSRLATPNISGAVGLARPWTMWKAWGSTR